MIPEDQARTTLGTPTPLVADNYKERFHAMISLNEAQLQADILMSGIDETQLDADPRDPQLLWVTISENSEQSRALQSGAEVRLQRIGQKDIHLGRVHSIKLPRVALALHTSVVKSHRPDARYKLGFVLNRVPLRRERFAVDAMSEPLLNMLLDPMAAPKQPDAAINNQEGVQWSYADLNREQKSAVRAILQRPAGTAPFIIFGPPGTGKTSTLVEAAYQVWGRVEGWSRGLIFSHFSLKPS